ncbi:class I glutamine amidotransferase-like protein [Sphaerulina musiva SO2202]|uniref:Class I glutamine amidotransferase-like protein n=1 Tax=Sphaerulina musiva (strain SO2202) TaxID=692275 RepID=M3C116_SPHMS|nr:class I glutamine amidotransferase-like protein [Sphaerulina musiva SO2202]EMF13981.1 class I glutamine amidotransferase-like protein [Sphaerulina musiva SO2202]
MISKARETVKMLVLETDQTDPNTMEESGSFGQIIDRLFTTAGNNHEPPLGIEVEMLFVVEDEENGHNGHVPTASSIPSDVHAILITGSMYDAHGSDAWILKLKSLITELWKTRPDIKFAGICFGHQLLARTLGATVEPEEGSKWELAHTEMDLSSVGQKLFKTHDNTLHVHQMHQDQVTTLPSSQTTNLLGKNQKVHIWASTNHTSIQGLYIRDRLFSSQGHLGLDETMVRRQVEARIQSGAIDVDEDRKAVQYAKETAHMEHDGEVIASAILRFFHGDDHDIA